MLILLLTISINQHFQPNDLISSSRKGKKKRERSHSSSSSSSSFVNEEETESSEKSLAQLQVRECAGSSETGQASGGFVSFYSGFFHEHSVMYLY